MKRLTLTLLLITFLSSGCATKKEPSPPQFEPCVVPEEVKIRVAAQDADLYGAYKQALINEIEYCIQIHKLWAESVGVTSEPPH